MMYSKGPSFYNPEFSLISRERQGASIKSVAARRADIRPQQSLQSNEQPQTLYWSQDTRHWPLYTFDTDPIETSVLPKNIPCILMNASWQPKEPTNLCTAFRLMMDLTPAPLMSKDLFSFLAGLKQRWKTSSDIWHALVPSQVLPFWGCAKNPIRPLAVLVAQN